MGARPDALRQPGKQNSLDRSDRIQRRLIRGTVGPAKDSPVTRPHLPILVRIANQNRKRSYLSSRFTPSTQCFVETSSTLPRDPRGDFSEPWSNERPGRSSRAPDPQHLADGCSWPKVQIERQTPILVDREVLAESFHSLAIPTRAVKGQAQCVAIHRSLRPRVLWLQLESSSASGTASSASRNICRAVKDAHAKSLQAFAVTSSSSACEPASRHPQPPAVAAKLRSATDGGGDLYQRTSSGRIPKPHGSVRSEKPKGCRLDETLACVHAARGPPAWQPDAARPHSRFDFC